MFQSLLALAGPTLSSTSVTPVEAQGFVDITSGVYELSQSLVVDFSGSGLLENTLSPSIFVNGFDVSSSAMITWGSQEFIDDDGDGLAEECSAEFSFDLSLLSLVPRDVIRVDVTAGTATGPDTWADAASVHANVEVHGSSRLYDGEADYDIAVSLYALEHVSGAYSIEVNGVDISSLVPVYDEAALYDNADAAGFSRTKFLRARLDFSSVTVVETDSVIISYSAATPTATSTGHFEVSRISDPVPGPPPCPKEKVEEAMDKLEEAINEV
ncbi:hypothetical protein [Engelhardtia mirabilis]|uniref:Uncharacterized protein n=1 Tax=Engelhardtia mirabilis TaxID=2528011 RepID=A0A518BHU0_9BACT|nr:hypothetical protein Pla133_16170 [Planctomycetes bacterium Pla133]QDV00867.1 hypothetical protein Pla86_16160 [Planctomycetes bacterium Pla86]